MLSDDEEKHWIFWPERHISTMKAICTGHTVSPYEIVAYMQYRSDVFKENPKKFNNKQAAEIREFDGLLMRLNKGIHYFCICLFD
jgi:hypothetical protein